MNKIAHICTSGIMHKLLVDKLTLQQKEGYKIDLISSKEGYNKELMSQYDINLRFVYMNRTINIYDDIKSILKLYKLLKEENYDIVHTHNAKAGIIGRIAAKMAGIPVIIHTTHGLPFFEGQNRIKYSLYKLLEKFGALFCDAISSQNKEDLKLIKSYAPRKQVFYEGNGVNLDYMDNLFKSITNGELSNIKENYGIPDNRKVILVGARFEPVKDHYFLLEGLKELKENHEQDFICLLAGRGYLEQEIRKKIEEMNLTNNVKIIGYKTNLYPFIKLADIIALTSKKEGIPRILMESMAFSKPVVASNVLGTRELVIHEKTGYLVTYRDKKSLASYLNILLNNDQLREQFGKEGRRIIEKKFTEQIVVNRLDKIYKQLINLKNKR